MNCEISIGTILQHPLEYSLGTIVNVLGFSEALTKMGATVHIFSPFEKTRKITKNLYIHNVKTTFSSSKIYKLIRLVYNYPILAKKLILSNKMIEKSARQLAQATLKYIGTNNVKLDIIQGEQEIPSLAAIEIAKKLGICSVAHFHNVWA